MSWFSKKKKEDVVEAATYTPQTKNQEHDTEETVKEKKIWNLKNIFIAFWIFVLFVAIGISTGFYVIDFSFRVIVWASLSIIYAIILFFLLEPSKLKEINRKEVKTVEKEVVKEVVKTVEKPVIKEVVKEVPKIVTQQVVKEVEKPVYYPVKGPKLDIPKYDYVASSLTQIYHKNGCRLAKSIKKKYKESTNNVSDFTRKKYKPCKFCITKEVKV